MEKSADLLSKNVEKVEATVENSRQGQHQTYMALPTRLSTLPHDPMDLGLGGNSAPCLIFENLHAVAGFDRD